MSRKSVLCIGQLVADVVVRPVNQIPSSGHVARLNELELVAGGCAANAACVLAKLDVKTYFAGLVGNDRFGEVVLADMAASGVDIEHVMRDSQAPTSAVVVLVDERGERSFLYREGSSERLTAAMIPEALFQQAGFVHVGGAMKLPLLDMHGILSRARQQGCVTSLDTDWDPLGLWMDTLRHVLPVVDYLLTNEEEGYMLTGEKDAKAIGKALRALGASTVLVKCGKRGAIVVFGEGVQTFPGNPVPVVDTTCAGDAFVAGFLYSLVQGNSLPGAVAFANAAGALAVTDTSHRAVISTASVHELIQQQQGE